MTIPRTTAKKLSTNVEFKLVDESFAPTVGRLSEKGLAQRIQRTRAARDKYRSLSERQNREARGRIAPRGRSPAASNQNTVKKQQLFDETLARYEKRAAQVGDGATSSDTPRKATTTKLAGVSAKKPGASTKQGAAATKKAGAATGKTASTPGATKRTTAATKSSVTAAKNTDAPAPKKSKATAAKKSPTKKSAVIPSLKQVVSKVSEAVSSLKDKAMQKAAPKRSSKAPAASGTGVRDRAKTGAAGNPKGPEFPRNAHERGRIGAAHKRQQARQDSR